MMWTTWFCAFCKSLANKSIHNDVNNIKLQQTFLKRYFFYQLSRSHGRFNTQTNQDEIMDTQWEGIPTNELIDMFALGTSCPAMVGKPKIFIIRVTLIIILLLEIKEINVFIVLSSF